MEGEKEEAEGRDNFFNKFGCERGERDRGVARGRHGSNGRKFQDVTGLNKCKS